MSVHFEEPENSVTESVESFNTVQERWPRLVLLSKRESVLLAAKSDDIMGQNTGQPLIGRLRRGT